MSSPELIELLCHGEITVKGTITTTQNPDGSTSYVAPFRAVSGTDAYKLVKGKGKVTGVSLPEDPTYGNYKVTGTLTY